MTPDVVTQLSAPPEKRARDRILSLVGSSASALVAAAWALGAIDQLDELTEAVPVLACTICPLASAALLASAANGALRVLSRCGRSLEASQELVFDAVRAAAGPTQAPPKVPARIARTEGRYAALALSCAPPGPVLAVERDGGDALTEHELERLAVFASLAGAALGAARSVAALREVRAGEAAVAAAVHEAALALDRHGTIRAIGARAAAVLGVRGEEVVGCVLGEVPGLAPLAAALGRPDRVPDVVSVGRRRLAIRARVHEGGVVATILDVCDGAVKRHSAGGAARHTFEDTVGRDPALHHAIENARRAADLDLPILITGETGTGKELLAQAIHNASARASAPFVGVNVTGIPRDLLESELFGYEAGAFTGARSSGHIGKFEAAGRGTILLDEIGDMPLAMQGTLLRVLQERAVARLGGARDVPVHARVIATTNRDLQQAVGDGTFRLDLFHRLRVIHLHLPPLRERRSDVRLLVERHLRRHAEITCRRVEIAPRVLEALEWYDWPGNVRELLNVLESELALLPPGESLLTRIPAPLSRRGAAGAAPTPSPDEPALVRAERPLAEIVRGACRDALARHGGNIAAAARALGISKGTLYRRLGNLAAE